MEDEYNDLCENHNVSQQRADSLSDSQEDFEMTLEDLLPPIPTEGVAGSLASQSVRCRLTCKNVSQPRVGFLRVLYKTFVKTNVCVCVCPLEV